MNHLFHGISLPFIAALIGWFTNWIAIKMLFHPKKRINLGMLKIQGIFPKRQKIFAEKLGMVVARELFSSQDIKEKISQSNIDKEVKTLIDTHINAFLTTKLKEAYPQTVMFIYNYIIRQFKDVTMKEIENLLPLVLQTYKQGIEKSLDIVDIEGTVAGKVSNFSSDKLEELLYSIMKKEFRFVEILGGVLGFIIGLIQVILINP